MVIDQIKGVNEVSSDESGEITGDILTDWEVDIAGNVYRSGDKIRENLAYLSDEFKESS